MKTVCITGATGQIGSYLSELFILHGYKVCGLQYESHASLPKYLDVMLKNPNYKLVAGDITNSDMVNSFVSTNKPDFFVNCAAQSNVRMSFDIPEYTMLATGNSVITCLDAIKQHSPRTRFVTLGSSEMFGTTPPPQNEISSMDPQSPYAKAKVVGHQATTYYRDTHGIFACNAICFNSESPRRPETFVSRKITSSAVRIKLGLQDNLLLGDLQSVRDFSHAQDTAHAIYQIVTGDEADDFIVASGKTHSVQNFVEQSFGALQLRWQDYVVIDQKLLRATPPNIFCGDNSKLIAKLNWQPKYSFEDLVHEMIGHDLALYGDK